MAELSRFYGIVIMIFFEDVGRHRRPHFHVEYAEFSASVGLDGKIQAGKLPRPAQKLVRDWVRLHREEIEDAWAAAASGRNPRKIAPLRRRG